MNEETQLQLDKISKLFDEVLQGYIGQIHTESLIRSVTETFEKAILPSLIPPMERLSDYLNVRVNPEDANQIILSPTYDAPDWVNELFVEVPVVFYR